MADTFKTVKITQPSPGGPLVQQLVGAVSSSSGAADGGKVVILDPTGSISPSLIPPTGSVAFDGIQSGTNTAAAMIVGTGASLTASGTGVIEATQIQAVVISATPPTVGQVLTATSATTADWETGGSGSSAFNAITTGTNTTAVMTVGTGATLTFSGSGVVNANELVGVVINTTPPTVGQALVATSPTAASWQTVSSSSAFNAITTGTNTTATMNVGTGATLDYTGSGVVNANEIGGINASGNTPVHAGQLLISQPGNTTAVWADPLVQGLYPPGTNVTSGPAGAAAFLNPVLIGGSDYAGSPLLHDWKVDSSGLGYVSVVGTVPVSGTIAVTQSTSPWVVSLTSTTITGTVAVTQSTSPWVVSGTVTANIGTTGGLALDATLTGGTQKTQVTDGTNALGTFANFGTTPGAVKALASNASIFSGTTALTNTAGSLNVNITGGSSSGTQYTNGTAVASGALVGTEAFGYDGTNVRAILTSSTGQQHVIADSGSTTAVTGTVAVTQSTSPWVVSLTSTTITGTVAVTQSTSPWVVSLASTTVTNTVAINETQRAGVTLGATAVTAFGTAPAAANVPGTNASIYAGTTGLTATGSSLNVNITGGASSGAQFAMGSAQSSSALGTIALGYDGTNVRGLLTSSTGQLHTIVDSSGTLTVNLAQVNGVAVSSPTAWGTAPTGNVIGTNSELFAGNTALTATGTSLNVNITGGGSGGTQYTEGTTVATPVGTAALGKNPSNVVETLRLDASNNLLVDLNTPIPAGTNLIGQVEVTDGAGHTQPAGDSVTRPIITEITDGTNILGTITHPLQVAQVGGGSSVNLSPSTSYAFTRVLVNVTTSGVSTIIAGVGGQTLRIYRFVLVIGSGVTLTLQDTAANVLFPATAFISNSTIAGEFDTQPKFPIAVNNGFALNLGTASTITGFIDYTQS